MKNPRLKRAPGRKSQDEGAALIIVLCFLVILTGVLLALYSSTRNDLINSKVFAGGQATTLLTDTAVNLVEGQITAASTQPQTSWASQPGMIHAYANSGSGTHTAYKLYSSGTMVDPNWGQDFATETQNMEGWKASSDTTTSYNAVWCDLNAPAVVYRTVPSSTGSNTTSTVTPVFPIADPGAVYQNGAGVQGFGFVTSGSAMVPGTNAGTSATDPARRLPMPVEWIYLLKNGQMIAPSNLTGSTATFTGTVPTASNPIIGRIAFWADDDTCKLNINTASEGTFWDIPRANLPTEWFLAYTLPILGEFQAISGHPATTCLDPVFGDLLPRPTFTDVSISESGIGTLNVTGSYTQLQPYYAMNPRISDIAEVYDPYTPGTGTATGTTSLGGTASTVRNDPTTTDLVPTVLYKTDRLYATPDELLFNPNRTFNPTWSTNTATTATLTAATLAQRDFFITAQSRAPETTLFGTPRICMWPIQSTGTYQSARDKLIAFCATTGTGSSAPAYYFQRGQVSLVEDTPPNMTNPAAASVSADWNNITRNQSLFTYATSMMETAAPGFGTSLGSTSKWGNVGCERVMTMALDMIRSGLSQVGTTSGSSPNWWSYRDDIIPSSGILIRGSVIPLQVKSAATGNTYSGIGRAWRVCSAAIQVIPTSRVPNPANTGTTTDGWTGTSTEPGTTGIQGILLLNFYNPMPTPQVVEPCFRVSVSNAGGFGISVAGTNYPIMGSSTTGTVLIENNIGGNGIGFRNYAFPGFMTPLYVSKTNSSGTPMRTLTAGVNDEVNNYPFLTAPVTISSSGTTTSTSTFSITGGTIQIQILEGGGTASAANVVQTESLTFPSSGPLPMPQFVNISSSSSGATTAIINLTGTYTFQTRTPTSSNSPGNYNNTGSSGTAWFQPGDIVAEVQLDPKGPTKGDYRLLAMARTVPANWFTANANYPTSTGTSTVTAFVCGTGADATAAAAAGHMLNRFAFAFQDSNSCYTYGIGSGYDSSLGVENGNSQIGERWGAVACAGVTLTGAGYGSSANYTVNSGGLVSTLKFAGTASTGINPGSIANMQPVIPPTSSGWAPTNVSGGAGDWTTDYGMVADGAALSAPDSGTWETVPGNPPAFFEEQGWCKTDQEAITEPNRAVPSPIGIFGSLPTPSTTGTLTGDGYGDDLQPWQSMLFCPNPSAGSSHPGFGVGGTGSVTTGYAAQPPFSTSPPDHLFNDLFWMPVVEPYAISDPLSTAGKVNLNYEMEPFTHITRRTALVGVLTPVEIGAINNAESNSYKSNSTTPSFLASQNTVANMNTRFPLNLDTSSTSPSYNAPGGTPPTSSTAATGCFTDFENRFSSGDVFRSASEVCMIRLVPTGQTASTLSSWWGNYQLTGLNMREAPYNQIYSRITTKSNTYTVHYWVQSLQQASTPGRNYATWNEGQDIKTGEYRGNTTIERYLDPHTPNLPDYTTVSLTGSYTPIDQYYSWRVVMQKQFAPGSN